jgi:alpha-galactosidase/6-phospho-beta-glucosidase family protein
MTKSRKPLNKKQIRNKIESGDIRRVLGEIMLKELNRKIPLKRSKIMKEEWQKRKTEWVKTLNTNLQQQVDTYRNRYYGYKYAVEKLDTPSGENSLRDRQHATLEQHRLNYNQSMQIKKDLMTRARAGEKIEVDVQIVMYFKNERSE